MQPEVENLAEIIALPTFGAAGAVALLYVWAIGKADDSGNINEYTTKAIETACMWEGKRGELLKAFHASGIIIGDIHDRDDEDPLRIANWKNVAADILNERQRTRARVQKHRGKADTLGVTESVTRYMHQGVTRYKNKEQRVKEQKSNRVQEQRTPCDLHEVEAFFRANGLSTSPQRFFDFYSTTGWTVDGEPVQNWRGLALSWGKADQAKTNPALAYNQRDDADYSGNVIDLVAMGEAIENEQQT